jgi:Skp family chaperone for outer membrane proteins
MEIDKGKDADSKVTKRKLTRSRPQNEHGTSGGIQEFLHAKSIPTPAVAATITMTVANGICFAFPELQFRYLCLILSAGIAYIVDHFGAVPESVVSRVVIGLVNWGIVFATAIAASNIGAKIQSTKNPDQTQPPIERSVALLNANETLKNLEEAQRKVQGALLELRRQESANGQQGEQLQAPAQRARASELTSTLSSAQDALDEAAKYAAFLHAGLVVPIADEVNATVPSHEFFRAW